jgi:DNA-binding NarL/FixJ family response regulator
MRSAGRRSALGVRAMTHNGSSPDSGVIVVDGHEAVRAAVKWWCVRAEPAIPVVGQYGSIGEMLSHHNWGSHRGSVVVLELNAPYVQPAYAGLQRILDAGLPVVIYSHVTASEVVLSALEAGAASYVSKIEAKTHLLEAIRAAIAGRHYAGPVMTDAIYNDSRVGRPRLAAREREILIAWFQTDSKELVARNLRISTSTVRTHLERIRAKYAAVGRAAPTKAALVVRAIQDGIIGVDDL